MLLLHGRRKMKIKQYEDKLVGCEECLNLGVRYIVYQEYYHVFFIPVFPFPLKTIKSYCLKCNSYNEKKSNHYLAKTKTPFYMYSGIILFLCLIVSAFVTAVIDKKVEKEYIYNPKPGDVYCLRNKHNNTTSYYLLKVRSIKLDTIELIQNAYMYSMIPNEMDTSDYFISNEYYQILKPDLINKYEAGFINFIRRKYGADNRFNVEK